MLLRVIFAFLLVAAILFLPFYVSFALALLGMFLFPYFWEAIVIFFLADLLFGTKEARYFGSLFLSSALSLTFLAIIEISKKKLKFYRR